MFYGPAAGSGQPPSEPGRVEAAARSPRGAAESGREPRREEAARRNGSTRPVPAALTGIIAVNITCEFGKALNL